MSTIHEIIQEKPKLLIDFFATWCGPCKMMTPILEEVKSEMGEDITIIKIDVDKNPKTAQAYNVKGVPTLAYFIDGNMQWKESGVIQAKDLVAKLKS